MATWTDEERRAYMREYMRMWRVTSPKYKMCKLRQSRAHKYKYDNNPEYREKLLAYGRQYKAKMREQKRKERENALLQGHVVLHS